MNIEMMEQIKQQWLFAADAMPQLICLIDRGGRIIRANRTLERWGLGQVEEIRGTHLHDALHRHCSDPACYLRLFLQDTAAALARDGRALCSAWDPPLERHFDIRIQMPVQEKGADSQASFAVAAFDDVTELRRLSAQHLTIQESERRRIAVDLHDGLGQTLSLVKLSVEEAARSARDGVAGKVAATLERLGPTVKSALAELRRMSMNLRPATLDDLGILATLAWYFREFETACPNIRARARYQREGIRRGGVAEDRDFPHRSGGHQQRVEACRREPDQGVFEQRERQPRVADRGYRPRIRSGRGGGQARFRARARAAEHERARRALRRKL